jgi:hypothetical protein
MKRAHHTYISAEAWGAFVAYYFRNRVLSVTVIEADPWRHPWWTDQSWSAETEQWVARVQPGFCLSGTGADPQVSVPENLAGEETLERLAITDPTSASVDAYLSEAPAIPLPAARWRAIGTDAAAVSGSPIEAVPERFAERGVMGPAVLDTTGDGGAVLRVDGLLEDRREARLLRACDLVLTHERVRSVIAPSLLPGILDVEFAQVNQISRPGPWLEIQRQYEPVAERAIADVVLGSAADTGRDEKHLATLYLLSPSGAEPGSDPDESWEPSVEYHATWNLQYRATYEDTIVEPTRLTIAVPQLGLGALGIRAQPVLDQINARTAELEAALRRVENVGTFSIA